MSSGTIVAIALSGIIVIAGVLAAIVFELHMPPSSVASGAPAGLQQAGAPSGRPPGMD
jgi:hypothetical protein